MADLILDGIHEDGLTHRQTLFINFYLETFNATKSAKLAGYTGDSNTLSQTGFQLLRNPKLFPVIERRLIESTMTAQEAMRHLSDIAKSKSEDTKDRIRSLELIAKAYGVFVNRTQIVAQIEAMSEPFKPNFEDFSDEQLHRYIDHSREVKKVLIEVYGEAVIED